MTESAKTCKTCGEPERSDVCEMWARVIPPGAEDDPERHEMHHAACFQPVRALAIPGGDTR